MKRILYISYDGLTDPLGQSQIIPYLQGLSQHGYSFTILSFEKKKRFAALEREIRQLLDPFGIKWVHLEFTVHPPMLSKLYDMVRLKNTAIQLQRENKFAMTHCRGYIGAQIGLYLKRKEGVKFIFDMRGFWADEKKDSGAWNMKNPIFRLVYKYYKSRERQYVQHASCIISLTKAGEREIKIWPYYNSTVPIKVIPCCADMSHFTLTSPARKYKSRKSLGINEGKIVLSYLGSVGSWYMLDEMIQFFKIVRNRYPGAVFLLITPSSRDYILKRAKEQNVAPEELVIAEATRQQVPEFLAASDLNIMFIKSVYSKISSSPTKLGEVLSMGIPVVANSGVGDVKEVIERTGGGIVIDSFTDETYAAVVERLPELLRLDGATIRRRATEIYDLTRGIAAYAAAYDGVFSPAPASRAAALL